MSRGFYLMNSAHDVMKGLTYGEVCVFIQLGFMMNEQNQVPMTVESIVDQIEVSRKTGYGALRALKELGVIRAAKPGVTVNPMLIWKGKVAEKFEAINEWKKHD